MNRSVKGLIAVFAAAAILTACSPEDASTTAASGGGTTTAVTGSTTTPPPVTTATRTEPATVPATTAAGTQAATTTGSSQSDDRVAEIMQKSTAAMEALENYRVTSESTFRLAEEEITSTSVMDIYPALEAAKMTTEIAGMSMESYTVENMVYSKGPDGRWIKMAMPDIGEEPGGEPGGGVTPMTEAEYAEYFVIEETAEGYRVRTRRPITLEEMQRIGNIPKEEVELPETDGEDGEVTVELDMLIDRDHYTSEMTMTMLTAAEEGTVRSVVHTTMSHFNELAPFTLPPEAEAAEPMEIPGLPVVP